VNYEYPKDRRFKVDSPQGEKMASCDDEDPEPVDLKRVLEERLRSEGRLEKVGVRTPAFSGSVSRSEALELADVIEKIAAALDARLAGDEKFAETFERKVLEKDAGAWDRVMGLFRKKEPGLMTRLFKGRTPEETISHVRNLKRIEAEKLQLDMLRALRQHARTTPFGDGAGLVAAGEKSILPKFMQEHPITTGALAGGAGALALRHIEGR
jgi:hypothetical protein